MCIDDKVDLLRQKQAHETRGRTTCMLDDEEAGLVHSNNYPWDFPRMGTIDRVAYPVVMFIFEAIRPYIVESRLCHCEIDSRGYHDEPGERVHRWKVEIVLVPVAEARLYPGYNLDSGEGPRTVL